MILPYQNQSEGILAELTLQSTKRGAGGGWDYHRISKLGLRSTKVRKWI